MVSKVEAIEKYMPKSNSSETEIKIIPSRASGNDIKNIQDILFDTITKLQTGQIDVKKASTIANIAQVVLNSKRLEKDLRLNRNLD